MAETERKTGAVKGAKEFDSRTAVKIGGEYTEDNDDFVPDPTAQFGTVDTSGTAGTAHSRIEETTAIFDVAKQQDMVTAARALDPDDDDVSASLVVLPGDVRDHDEAIDAVRAAAEKALAEPVVIGGPTLAQREAAEEGPKAEKKAEAQRKDQGAGTGKGSTGTTSTS